MVAEVHRQSQIGSAGLLPDVGRWVLSRLKSKGPLVLLVDETSLQEHLKVMVVAVVYWGKAIPLAWRCYRQEAWPMGQEKLIESLLQWGPRVWPRGIGWWWKRTWG